MYLYKLCNLHVYIQYNGTFELLHYIHPKQVQNQLYEFHHENIN